jgi:glycosyltransferase involved in cell wall biosynthesis
VTNVAFDATPLLTVRTGIGHSVAELRAALARRSDVQLMPFALGLRSPRLRHLAPTGTRMWPVPTRAALAVWKHFDWPRGRRLTRGADIVHATNFVVPPVDVPAIVTVNDVFFARQPGAVTSVVRSFGVVLKRALDAGVWVHTTTEAVGIEVEELMAPGLRGSGRLVVAPWGVPALPEDRTLTPDVEALVHGRPFVLAIGTLEPRKNLPRLVAAFGRVARDHSDLLLVLAGPPGTAEAEIIDAIDALDPAVRPRVVRTGRVNDATRAGLLERAEVLAYPSLYEGFGFPPLEAMSVGTPVVAGRSAPLEEVVGGDARLVDPLDIDDIATALHETLAGGMEVDERRAGGKARAASYTFDRAASILAPAYARLAATSVRPRRARSATSA